LRGQRARCFSILGPPIIGIVQVAFRRARVITSPALPIVASGAAFGGTGSGSLQT